MPQFISKLQHNTYEKGEFSDEQPRNLDETIQLIKDFPWDLERPLTDIQLTGPSVTIQDDGINYLKLGLYFGGKFCVYYLDKNNHLYDYHAADIEAVEKLVADFFNQTFDLRVFEKYFFNIGNQPHFVTNKFEYHVKVGKIVALSLSLLAYTAVFSLLFLKITEGRWLEVFPILMMVISIAAISYFVATNLKGRHQYIQISKGNNKFSYGVDEQHIIVYDKTDIRVILYNQNSRNRSGILDKCEIVFNNGEIITLSGALLSGDVFFNKFDEKLGIPVIYTHRGVFKNKLNQF
ncbi:hypothetical protein PQ469_12710 [Mucilaginibacter sp. KACC 22773]|jgi:hypothetical protein|uniref:hypothetical protein n=1 Tax=Mucilaginibacter sp. KACC 22773 TaxID=3025671 RepID=UPI0023659D81|nr:hypothetical protein [Mucilaginibacter sp. KACC 22773]WDF80869.1 hypothetical protein PQ469_12710 [Mucilaginibacter sp. KACC 22773]